MPDFPKLAGGLKDAKKHAFKALDSRLNWGKDTTILLLADERAFGAKLSDIIREEMQGMEKNHRTDSPMVSFFSSCTSKKGAYRVCSISTWAKLPTWCVSRFI